MTTRPEEVDRARCLEKQLSELKVKPTRPNNQVRFPGQCKKNFWRSIDTKECLENAGFGDCLGPTGHLTTSLSNLEDWCTHKRMFQDLVKKADTAEYIIVVNDA